MNEFTSYRISNGRVVQVMRLPESQVDPGPPPEGEAYYPGDYPDKFYYFSDGAPTERPSSPVSMTTPASLTIRLVAVPVGAVVSVNGESTSDSFISDDLDGEIELVVPAPGDYAVAVTMFPMLDFNELVNVL